MVGITENELEEMIKYYELDKLYNKRKEVMKKWYDNYKFNEKVKHTIYNTDMILYYINEFRNNKEEPKELVDINVRTDYRKLKYLVHTNNRLNGNFNVLKTLFVQNYINVEIIKDSFSAFELTKSENFIALLYYLGLLTIAGEEMGDVKLTIPNQTIRRIMAEFVHTMLVETNTLEVDLRKFHEGMKYLAFKDDLGVFYYLADRLDKTTSIRDLITQESDIKIFFMTYFSLNRLYATISELELNKGYADIFLLKAPNIEYDIPNILIEFKFLKQNEKYNLDNIVTKAKEQIQQYKATSKFSVDRSIIVVFQGFKLVYCEFEN